MGSLKRPYTFHSPDGSLLHPCSVTHTWLPGAARHQENGCQSSHVPGLPILRHSHQAVTTVPGPACPPPPPLFSQKSPYFFLPLHQNSPGQCSQPTQRTAGPAAGSSAGSGKTGQTAPCRVPTYAGSSPQQPSGQVQSRLLVGKVRGPGPICGHPHSRLAVLGG